MELSYKGISEKSSWESVSIALPTFDIESMVASTIDTPNWVHFGAGNIFRAYIARLAQTLLSKNLMSSGIVAVETFDSEIVEKVYKPYDNLSIFAGLCPDGSMKLEVIASVADSICPIPDSISSESDFSNTRLEGIFSKPSLQLVTATITEKGYSIFDIDGNLLPEVARDIASGPYSCTHVICIITSLLLKRFSSGALPIAIVSLDNLSRNGEVFRKAVIAVAREWTRGGFADAEFLDYLEDDSTVSFPLTMIDKITPYPSYEVLSSLRKLGIKNMDIVITEKKSYTAAFVNAEIPEYLVIEDNFPNGRPPLEKSGVLFTDGDTVCETERMKVTTCLNPLHTAMSVYGCLLGYDRISDVVKDADIKRLIKRIGYDEGLPVAPGSVIIDPRNFLDEVINIRLPNPFLCDTPQRIATDTSKKVAVRFGETIKSYLSRDDLDINSLTAIPLAIAGWLRYLMAIDDAGKEYALSPDPMQDELSKILRPITFGKPETVGNRLVPILSNIDLFGTDLYKATLGSKIEEMFTSQISAPGAVRKSLKAYLAR